MALQTGMVRATTPLTRSARQQYCPTGTQLRFQLQGRTASGSLGFSSIRAGAAARSSVESSSGASTATAAPLLHAGEGEEPGVTVSSPSSSGSPPAPGYTEDGHVWYFAFGSNLSPSVLEGRRGVTPLEALPCTAPGHRLAFDVRGMPYREPSFASVQPIATAAATAAIGSDDSTHPTATAAATAATTAAAALTEGVVGAASTAAALAEGLVGVEQREGQRQNGLGGLGGGGGAGVQQQQQQEVHGVAFRLSPQDWATVCATEWATEDGTGSYLITPISLLTYCGRQLTALSLACTPQAAVPQGVSALPSERYMGLITEGAAHHGLAPEYRSYLESLPLFRVPQGSPRYALGKSLYSLLSLLLFWPLLAYFAVSRLQRRLTAALKDKKSTGDSGGKGASRPPSFSHMPGLMRAYLRMASGATWWLHQHALKPVFGCGLSGAEAGAGEGGAVPEAVGAASAEQSL